MIFQALLSPVFIESFVRTSRKKTRANGFPGNSSCESLRFRSPSPKSPFEYSQQLSPSSVEMAYNLPANTPVSPRVQNLREDLDILTMSRQDNPYISSKLELLSNCCGSAAAVDDVLTLRQQLTSPNSVHYSISMNRDSVGDASQSLLWSEEDVNEDGRLSADILDDDSHLHDFLVRSPPPQFPTKFSAFVFPEPGSPLHSMHFRAQESHTFIPDKSRSPTQRVCSESGPMPTTSQLTGRRQGTNGRTLLRRASAGSHHPDSLISELPCTGSDLYQKRASSGPNILRSAEEGSRALLPESESREALLHESG